MIERLLAQGGWQVVDPQPIAAANPESFWLPPAELLDQIVVGSAVRAIFEVVDQAHPVRDALAPYDDAGRPQFAVRGERMWSWVEAIDGDLITGVLQNIPLASHARIELNHRVQLRFSDLIDVIAEPTDLHEPLGAYADMGFPPVDLDGSRAPVEPDGWLRLPDDQLAVCTQHGVSPVLARSYEQCVMHPSIDADTPAVWATRLTPHEPLDCGWMLQAHSPDAEQAAAIERFELVTVFDAAKRRPDLVPFLALPYGWAVDLAAGQPPHVEHVPHVLED